MRIRHFGLLANRVRTRNLQNCRQLLSTAALKTTPPTLADGLEQDRPRCPACGRGRMVPGPDLSAPELHGVITRMDSS